MNDAMTYGKALRVYLRGFAIALILTLIPFGLVASGVGSPSHRYLVIGICALVQIIVHFRFFLHIDLSKQKRDDLWLILFSCLLLIIMAGGTIWIMWALALRMD